ncbi:MAG TPA: carboxypeptidase regulatory-like domain-containing protein, partial [Blastocatellia bacterium]|nr:carboxypeptidase regulatory-like domain-containing protein [Blastocatellia bacterium]
MRSSASYTIPWYSRKEPLDSPFYLLFALGFLLSVFMAPIVWAQAPVGTISGTVTDPSGAIIKDAPIIIRNKATGFTRQTKSENDGVYSAPALPAGQYEIKLQMQGFRTLVLEVTVATGTITSANLQVEIGQTTEIVTVNAGSAAQINAEAHSIDGIITRQKIQELPLNGRNFLNLASLEPGVTIGYGSTSQYNAPFEVSILGGSSSRTSITVDGGTVRNSIEGNTGMNFSQEVIQEFQLSSTNFDLSTGITSVGGVNIVTRTGGNQFHGSGYFFFRDHNMSAYPGLKRICQEPRAPALCNNVAERKAIEDPFFARRNPGVWIGGPIIKDRLFFFSNYEYTNQTAVVTYQPNYAPANSLAGNFANPYAGHLFSTRLDWKVTDNHTAFLRYSHDQNKGFGPRSGASLPSNWLQNKNFSDQGVIGVTSTFTPTLVNDFRFNYTYWQNRNLFPDSTVCPDCVGLNFPQLQINGTNVTVGNTSNATQGRDLRRFTFLDTLNWQKGSHRFRFGTEIEHAPGTGFWGYCDPACAVGLQPETVTSIPTSILPEAIRRQLFPLLPTTISTGQDLLNLPFAGAVVGVGDPSQPPPYNIDKAKINQRLRFFGQDTWKIKPNFTFNYGLAWNFESTLVNSDLDKPQYLAPLYGSDLSPTKKNYYNFSPALGFAWNPDKGNKTVLRGGAGIYWDTEQLWMRLEERGY